MTDRVEWVLADPHFGHQGVCEFLRGDGSKLRPWTDAREMDEALVANWNAVVDPRHRVYLLGDVAMNKRALQTVRRLNGRIVLVKGNHDVEKLKTYAELFDDVRAYVVKNLPGGRRCILSHVPIHPESVARFEVNVHGHLHANSIPNDPRYVCVSVEQIDYAPLLLTDAVERAYTKHGPRSGKAG